MESERKNWKAEKLFVQPNQRINEEYSDEECLVNTKSFEENMIDFTACYDLPTIASNTLPVNLTVNFRLKDFNTPKFIEESKPEIYHCVYIHLLKHHSIEYNIVLLVKLVKSLLPVIKTFKSKYIAVKKFSEITDTIDVLTELLLEEIKWHLAETDVLGGIIESNVIEVNIRKLPVQIGMHIPFPSNILSSESVINVINVDNYCFKWALLSAVTKGDSGIQLKARSVPSTYAVDIYEDSIYFCGVHFNFTGLRFPLEVRFCRTFEKNNPHISVNVFGLEITAEGSNKLFGPLYRTRGEKKLHINLLYLEDTIHNKFHYAYIRDLSCILKLYYYYRKYVCNTCLRHFISKKKILEHKNHKLSCRKPITFS